jgi:NitT/TauT family transport system substrate-binding protein
VAPTSSAAAVPLNFQLSWFPGGDNLAFWAGLDQGFFLEEGIDLTIDSATDPTISQKLIATGEKPIGIAYAGDIVISNASGAPITAIWALTDESPFGLISLKEAGITKAEDLKGKTVGVTSLPTDQAFFDTMLKSVGLTRDDVTVVDPGLAGVQQLLAGTLDATSAIINYEPAVLKSEGVDSYDFLYYSQYGAPNAPFYAITVNPEWLADNGDVATKFLRAYQKSITWTNANVDEAVRLFIERFPDQDAELTKNIYLGEAAIMGTGSNDLGQWQGLADYLQADGTIDANVDAKTFVTNDYLP